MGRDDMRNVFLSHASADKEAYVLPFAGKLDEVGITYWLDDAEIKWGDKIALKINEGIAKSNYVIVFLTRAFLGRNWTEAELSAALSRENNEGRSVVLPIVVGDPRAILSKYPLLRDKRYCLWDDGPGVIVSELAGLLRDQKHESGRSPSMHIDTPRAETFEDNYQVSVMQGLQEVVTGIPRNVLDGVVINSQGDVCLMHSSKFESTPFFVGYHVDTKRIEIVFVSGESKVLDWLPNKEVEAALTDKNTILIIHMSGNMPVDGYETALARLKNGKMIDKVTAKKNVWWKRCANWFLRNK